MFRRTLAVLGILSCGLMPNSMAQEKPQPQKIDGLINWVYDYEGGKLKSLAEDKPMFVVFRCER